MHLVGYQNFRPLTTASRQDHAHHPTQKVEGLAAGALKDGTGSWCLDIMNISGVWWPMRRPSREEGSPTLQSCNWLLLQPWLLQFDSHHLIWFCRQLLSGQLSIELITGCRQVWQNSWKFHALHNTRHLSTVLLQLEDAASYFVFHHHKEKAKRNYTNNLRLQWILTPQDDLLVCNRCLVSGLFRSRPLPAY